MSRILTTAAGPFCGVGLHGGGRARMSVQPSPAGSGVSVALAARGGEVIVPACLERVVPARRRTILRRGRAVVSTVEHVLAALWGLGIHDAVIRVDGPEVPIMDGSAAPFARELLRASEPAEATPRPWTVARSVHAVQGRSRCHLLPSSRLEISCLVDFSSASSAPAARRQHLRYEERGPAEFMRRLAAARTFGFIHEAARLRRAGLARGAGLNNALVLHRHGVVNPGGTRFLDEPVRHKVLDALGDIALLGAPLRARIKLARCGHHLLTSTLLSAIQKGALVREP